MKIVLRSHEYPPDKFSVVQFSEDAENYHLCSLYHNSLFHLQQEHRCIRTPVETKTRSHFEATLPIVFMVSRTVSRVSARAPSIMNQVTGIFFFFKRFAVFIMSSRLKSLARLSSIKSQVDSAPISTSLKPASFIRSSSSSSTAPGESPIACNLSSSFFLMTSRNTSFA